MYSVHASMKFKYKAKTKEGEEQVGFVEAGGKDSAITILASHGLFILSLEPVSKPGFFDRISTFFGRVKRKDLVVFTRQMAILMEAELPLTTSIQTLHKQTTHVQLKEATYQMMQDIDSGLAFSQALARQPHVFPEFFVSMIRSAEVTGNLAKVIGFLADYLEKEDILSSKAKSAMIYPLVVLGLFAVVVVIMLTFVFPQILPVFSESGVELPAFTKVMLGTGQFISEWWFALLFLLAILAVAAVDYFRSPEGIAFLDDLKIRLPIIKRIYVPLTLTRFASTASMLLKGGVPITQAIEIVGQTIDNVLYRDLFHEVSERVSQGERLADALAAYPKYFPPLVYQMIAVGETTGQVDQILIKVGDFYGREADSLVSNLVELIQPVLMIGIGVLVALLFASILMPLYQLTSSIQ